MSEREYVKPHRLERAAALRRFDALFRTMARDFLLREQFVTDPAQIAAEFVYGERIAPRRASVINQLVYAIMANPRLTQWVHDYTIRHRFRLPSSERLIRDFSHAVARTGGHDVVVSLIRASVEQENVVSSGGSATEVAFFMAGCAHVKPYVIPDKPPTTYPATDPLTEQSGTHVSTGTGTGTGTEISTEISTGTEISTDTGTGTEMSTGTGTGTEMSTGTGTGTEMSTGTGTGTEMSTGTGTGTGTEQSTGTGTGTEQSTGTGTGTGTEESTGTGTEQSTGTDNSGFELPFGSYVQVSFDALARFAIQLRETGVLSAIEVL